MKNLILLCAVSLLSITAVNAQANLKPLQSDQGVHAAGLDTVTNAGSISQVIQISGYQDVITIQSAVLKLTGTPTGGGSLKLYGSIDGVKYDVATTATDTLAVTNVTPAQIKTWKFLPSTFQYYKVIYKGSGTQTSQVNSTAMWRKK